MSSKKRYNLAKGQSCRPAYEGERTGVTDQRWLVSWNQWWGRLGQREVVNHLWLAQEVNWRPWQAFCLQPCHCCSEHYWWCTCTNELRRDQLFGSHSSSESLQTIQFPCRAACKISLCLHNDNKETWILNLESCLCTSLASWWLLVRVIPFTWTFIQSVEKSKHVTNFAFNHLLLLDVHTSVYNLWLSLINK